MCVCAYIYGSVYFFIQLRIRLVFLHIFIVSAPSVVINPFSCSSPDKYNRKRILEETWTHLDARKQPTEFCLSGPSFSIYLCSLRPRCSFLNLNIKISMSVHHVLLGIILIISYLPYSWSFSSRSRVVSYNAVRLYRARLEHALLCWNAVMFPLLLFIRPLSSLFYSLRRSTLLLSRLSSLLSSSLLWRAGLQRRYGTTMANAITYDDEGACTGGSIVVLYFGSCMHAFIIVILM